MIPVSDSKLSPKREKQLVSADPSPRHASVLHRPFVPLSKPFEMCHACHAPLPLPSRNVPPRNVRGTHPPNTHTHQVLALVHSKDARVADLEVQLHTQADIVRRVCFHSLFFLPKIRIPKVLSSESFSPSSESLFFASLYLVIEVSDCDDTKRTNGVLQTVPLVMNTFSSPRNPHATRLIQSHARASNGP